MELVKWFILSVTLIKYNTNGARILAVFPTPSISHQVVFRPLTQELVRRGHEVTVITTDPVHSKDPDLMNLIEIDLHNVSYSFINKELTNTYAQDQSLYSQIYILANHFVNIFEEQLKSDDVQGILHKGENFYDLLLIEACVRPALIFSHIFKAPVIHISSLGGMLTNYEALGVPIHPTVYFTSFRQKLYNLSLWDKLMEIKMFLFVSYIHLVSENLQNSMLRRRFGVTVPTISELNKNIDMLFLATNPIWSGNTPVPPNVIYIGGIHEYSEENTMQKDLSDVLDSSVNGVIYMSFGSNVKTAAISVKTSQICLQVFSKLNFDVIWKWDQHQLPVGKSAKVHFFTWVPQRKLLKHPKVKLFITQGGLQSTDEAIFAGVPLIGIPFIADQWYNTEQYVHFNIGLKLDYNDLNEEKLRRAIEKVASDESYRHNIARLRSLILDQPQTALERAIWWTEYLLRNGNTHHLRSPSANMPWMKLIALELLTISLIISSFVFLFIYTAVKTTWKHKIKFTANKVKSN